MIFAIIRDRGLVEAAGYRNCLQAIETRTAIHGPRSEASRGQALTFHNTRFARGAA